MLKSLIPDVDLLWLIANNDTTSLSIPSGVTFSINIDIAEFNGWFFLANSALVLPIVLSAAGVIISSTLPNIYLPFSSPFNTIPPRIPKSWNLDAYSISLKFKYTPLSLAIFNAYSVTSAVCSAPCSLKFSKNSLYFPLAANIPSSNITFILSSGDNCCLTYTASFNGIVSNVVAISFAVIVDNTSLILPTFPVSISFFNLSIITSSLARATGWLSLLFVTSTFSVVATALLSLVRCWAVSSWNWRLFSWACSPAMVSLYSCLVSVFAVALVCSAAILDCVVVILVCAVVLCCSLNLTCFASNCAFPITVFPPNFADNRGNIAPSALIIPTDEAFAILGILLCLSWDASVVSCAANTSKFCRTLPFWTASTTGAISVWDCTVCCECTGCVPCDWPSCEIVACCCVEAVVVACDCVTKFLIPATVFFAVVITASCLACFISAFISSFIIVSTLCAWLLLISFNSLIVSGVTESLLLLPIYSDNVCPSLVTSAFKSLLVRLDTSSFCPAGWLSIFAKVSAKFNFSIDFLLKIPLSTNFSSPSLGILLVIPLSSSADTLLIALSRNNLSNIDTFPFTLATSIPALIAASALPT